MSFPLYYNRGWHTSIATHLNGLASVATRRAHVSGDCAKCFETIGGGKSLAHAGDGIAPA